MVVFDKAGQVEATWGDEYLNHAHGAFIDADDRLWLTDRYAQVVWVCETDGTVVRRLGYPNVTSAEGGFFNHPTNMHLGPDGSVYVSDGYANSVVHKFAPDGELMFTWGSPGTGPGQFWVPHAIALDSEGLVYVADRENNRVQVFTPDGEYIREWGDVYVPTDIFIDRNDICYMTERFTDRFHVFDKMGNLLARGRVEGEGHAVCADSHGDMYVAQMELQCVDKFVKRRS